MKRQDCTPTFRHSSATKFATTTARANLLVICVLACLTIGTAKTHAAPEIQLTGTAPENLGVEQFRSSPDAQWIFFTSSQSEDECESLYRVHRTGGPATRLSGPPLDDCELDIADFTASGQRLVFSRYRNGPADIFSIPTEGDEDDLTILLQMAADAELDTLRVFGEQVIFAVEDATTNFLFLAPAAGPASAAQQIETGPESTPLRLVPNSQRFLYLANGALYSRSLANGSSSIRLDQSFGVGDGVRAFLASPAGTHVAFSAEQSTPDERDLYVVAIDGPASSAIRVSQPLPSGQEAPTHQSYLRFSSDGSTLLFHSMVGDMLAGGHLHSTPSDGSGPAVQLDQASSPIFEFEFAGDDATAVFLTRQDNPSRSNIYAVPAAGPATAVRRLNDVLEAAVGFDLANDGDTVVYSTDGGFWSGGDGPNEYYRVSATDSPSTPHRLSGLGLTTRIDVSGVGRQIGDRWVYTGQIDDGPQRELFSVSLSGPRSRSAVSLNTNQSKANVNSFFPAKDNSWIVFNDTPNLITQPIIMMGEIDGSPEAQTVHGLLPAWFRVSQYRVMPDDTSILYTVSAGDPTPQGRTLYLQRIPSIFADDFESGSIETWSP